MTTSDIVRLRDIGPPDNAFGQDSPISIAPDGRSIAFTIQQANPGTNAYCQGLVLLRLGRAGRPRLIDRGGDPVRFVFDDLRGMTFPTGSQAVVQPMWSPDGQHIAYLKRTNGRTQVWIADVRGRGARQLSHAETDVENVRWSSDGRHLWIGSHPGLVSARADVAAERLFGYHYDARVMPLVGPAPFVRPVASKRYCIDHRGRAARPKDCGLSTTEHLPVASSRAVGQGIEAVRIDQQDPMDFVSPQQLHIISPDGRDVVCRSPLCQGKLTGAWLVSGAVVFSRREGWANNILSFYRIGSSGDEPKRLLSTSGVIMGCRATRTTLICAEEDATSPRRLVEIDAVSGARHLLFDPNPEFADFKLGAVRRLEWRSDGTVQNYGDLVLPPSHVPGQRHPLVIVQYTSRGFLRGGTGDEVPIFALAQAGFVVLSFQRPPPYAETITGRKFSNWIEAEPENVRGWNERRSLLSALLGGIQAAKDTGVVEPTKIGLTGMSDGASTAQFALINAPIFAATSLSTCCEDPRTLLSLAGPAFATEREQAGWPGPATNDIEFWKPYSLALNAPKISGPILMQLPSDEYEEGLEAYDALKAANKTVDMYIFDGEHHVKSQPSHRQAIYDRNVKWFRFWLLDQRNCSPADAECQRWLGFARERR